MIPSPPPSARARAASPARRLAWGFVLLACLGGIGFLLFSLRPRSTVPPTASLPEAHRTNLVTADGRWQLPGQTSGFTGLLLETYDDGAKKSRSALSNGVLHGLSIGWHTNGQQQVAEYFVAGTSHGVRTKWHPNGQKLSEVTVVDGTLQGTFRSWHPNGARAEEVALKNGQPDGLSRAWFPSGFLKSQVTLRNGKVVAQQFWKDGEYKEGASIGSGRLSDH